MAKNDKISKNDATVAYIKALRYTIDFDRLFDNQEVSFIFLTIFNQFLMFKFKSEILSSM